MKILGVSAFYHDSAAALLIDGDIIAAAQEERFSRIKHDPRFPENAITYVLKEGRIEARDLDFVVFYDKPLLKFDRLLETHLAYAPLGLRSFVETMKSWLGDKLFLKYRIIDRMQRWDPSFSSEKLLFSEHHLSHAASCFYPSPFKDAVILTLDGVGEWATTSVAIGRDRIIQKEKEIKFPDSLGLLYAAFTSFCGFKVNSGEYKLMGLAPYGEPIFTQVILDNLVDVKADGSFKLNMEYFDFCVGAQMTSHKFDQLFGCLPRLPEAEFSQIYLNLAASIQKALDEILVKICINLSKEYQQKNLCLSGGVALNCVTNGAIRRHKIFSDIWVQPAAGDAGGAVGAALAANYIFLEMPRNTTSKDQMHGSLLGPSFSDSEIEQALKNNLVTYQQFPFDEICGRTSAALKTGKVVGWFQGRMEFGPRSLGNRSILADPTKTDMKSILNSKIKLRESFRPFAPAILEDCAGDWFESVEKSPYMLFTTQLLPSKRIAHCKAADPDLKLNMHVSPHSVIPAVTHVDFSARVQTVSPEESPTFYGLLNRFYLDSGCPLLVNTSFNVRGEPPVCSPQDAITCFLRTDIDILVIGSFIVLKEENKENTVKQELPVFMD